MSNDVRDPSAPSPAGRLVRVRDGAVIAGVCGGIARWLDADPTVVRIIYAVISLVSAAFPGVLVYLILWLIMPRE